MRIFQGQQDAGSVPWEDIPWHLKAQHLIDHVADAFMTYYYLWIPAVASSMFASLYLFSTESSLPELLNIFMTHGTPMVQPPVFGRKAPQFEGENADEEMEDGASMDE
ncbi:hypothetical protein XU18_4805 [Perkinsela sp. CCAP 1560/4]|nr:hypothetical protein XU18_4805 [Perkinsela sp. CCAP 1560/4]|eukprot:KNH03851.1 hypothetical protein XU18_4805 [Perkinsela sp. CCAP 1560/4]